MQSLASTWEVVALSRNFKGSPLPNVRYLDFDLAGDSGDWNFASDIDVIIHLAQSDRFRDFPSGASDVFDVNIYSTARLLDMARQIGVQRFILASSGGVYGTGDFAFSENSSITDHGELGFYLGSKLCAEVLARNYASLFDVSILRFFFMYGRDQKRSMLIPRLVDSVLKGRAIHLQGPDGIRINPIHVSDAVRAVEGCLALEGSHTFNVAGDEVLSLREIGQIIGEVVDRPPVFTEEDAVSRSLIGDIQAMKASLCVPKVDFAHGIRDLIAP